jgi:hypothetical protein
MHIGVIESNDANRNTAEDASREITRKNDLLPGNARAENP